MSKVLASPNAPSNVSVPVSLARLAFASVAGLALLSAGLYLGALRLGETLRLAGASTDAAPIAVSLGRHRLSIPANAIRFPEQRTEQPQREIDLYLSWPEMAGFSSSAQEIFHDPEATSLLFVRLSTAEATGGDVEAPSPATPQVRGPAGLLRSSRAGLPGIASEEAVYRAPDGREPAYEASCLDGKDAIMAADCIRELRLAPGLRLRYRFSHALLPDWDRIDRAVLAYLAEHRRS